MKRVTAEIVKDLTHVPIPELGPHLAEAIEL
ncbi:MAG: hypothetical protein EXR04_05970 [Rhodospirillales bacterium]|nr:hypothetical protein [Rhodospirillales bacterium]